MTLAAFSRISVTSGNFALHGGRRVFHLSSAVLGVELCEDRPQHGGNHRMLRVGQVHEHVAHEVGPTALSTGTGKEFGDGGLEAEV